MKSIWMVGTALIALSGCTMMNPPTMTAPVVRADTDDRMAAITPIPVPDNVLLADWTGPFDGVPPWDKVRPQDFDQAFDFAIGEQSREYALIASNPAAPTFANTFVAMERSGRRLARLNALFGVETSNVSTPAYEALDAKWSPRLAAASDEIYLNGRLFARIEAIHAARTTSGLDAKQQRLVALTYDSFVSRGAKLGAEQKVQMSAINQSLAGAYTEFNSRLLADEATYTQATAAQMVGVPQDVRDAAAAAVGDARLAPGSFAIRNTRSVVEPVLTFARDRALREKVWRGFVNRGDNGDAHDTNAIITKIVKARADRAHLLGYGSHADWVINDKMAKTPARALDLMMRVWPSAVARVNEEVAEMAPLARKDGVASIEPWDYRYYQEQVRKAKYDLSEDELKPYFEQSNLIRGMMWSAEQLYDLKFTENTGSVPVFDPEVRTFAVSNAKTGAPVGLFYLDPYARNGKRSGAWMTTYRDHVRLLGDNLVLASNNNNFTKPAAGQPVLISLDDTKTLWHEFGHAIHGFLTDVEFPSLTNPPSDFVEYPSQVNENWVLTRAVLDRFALHYKTGKPMPAALLDKIDRSSTFGEGFKTVEYLSSALVDMMLHTQADGVVDPDAFEKQALAKLGMPGSMVMRHRLPQFGHLFSSDAYSAGYYSYLWSETMDADTWAAFTETGDPFDRATADRFRTTMLMTGNETDRAEAYRAFRGRDPDVNALLKRRGFPVK